MTTFKDNQNREWTIRLDFALLQAIRDGAQVDLGNIEELAKTWAGLLYDDAKSLLVVWIAVERAASAQSVDKSTFLQAMDGESLEQALVALGAAIESFTQPRKRGMVERAIRGVNEGMAKAVKQAEEAIELTLAEKSQEVLG
jgi:hypothetical protein